MIDILIPMLVLIVVCVLAYTIYLIYSVEDQKFKYSLIIILFLSGILKGVISSEADLTDWDEKYHALVAKNMTINPLQPKLYPINHPQLIWNDWTFCHDWLHKPPLSLWAISGSFRIFGFHAWAVRLPSILYSMLGMILLFLLAKKYFNDRVALISTILFGIHGLFMEMIGGRATTDHVDVFFITSFLGAVYFLASIDQRKILNYLGAILFIAAGMYSKGMLIWGAPLLVFVVKWNEFKRYDWLSFTGVIVLGLALFIPWMYYQSQRLPELYQFEQAAIWNHVFHPIENHYGDLFFYFMHMRIIFGELIYLILIYAGYEYYKGKKKGLGMLLLWIGGPLIFFTLAATKMQSYIMVALPAFAIMTAYVCDVWILKRGFWRFGALVVLLLWARYSVERIKPFANDERIYGTEQNIRKSVDSLDHPLIIFNSRSPIKTMVFTDAICFPFKPKTTDVVKYMKDGYTVYFEDDEGAFTTMKSQ